MFYTWKLNLTLIFHYLKCIYFSCVPLKKKKKTSGDKSRLCYEMTEMVPSSLIKPFTNSKQKMTWCNNFGL